jgi:hypothetical protein
VEGRMLEGLAPVERELLAKSLKSCVRTLGAGF